MLLQEAKLEWKNTLVLCSGAVSRGPHETTASGNSEQIILLSLPGVFISATV